MSREDARDFARKAIRNKTLRRSRTRSRPSLENLEGRLLMTRAYPFPLVPPNVRNVIVDRNVFSVRLDGPGALRVRPAGQGTVGLDLFGTTQESTVTVTRRNVGLHAPYSTLPIGQINVRTGRLGGIQGTETADLLGSMTTLVGGVRALEFNTIGPRARVDVEGDLGQLTASGIALGPAGRIEVSGNLGGMNVGQMTLDGGMILVDQGIVTGAVIGGFQAVNGGRLAAAGDVALLSVVHDATMGSGGAILVGGDLGQLAVGGDLGIQPGGRLEVSRDLTGAATFGDTVTIDAGLFAIGRDIVGPFTVNDDLSLLNGGTLTAGRDVREPMIIGDDMILASNGKLLVGRDLNGLTVEGNLDTSGGGAIHVGGYLRGLTVSGAFIGKDIPGDQDLVVGLDLTNLRVQGFVPLRGSIVDADILIGKSLVGIDVAHGIFNSFLTADVLIDGGDAPVPGGNFGPDGPIAVFDSEIRAGVQIRNITINGDVVSSKPSNPEARATRIVAGQNRAGVFSQGGNIDNFQITGTLIDAVIVASVAPEGGDGNLSLTDSGLPGDGTYDAPAGVVPTGTYGLPVFVPHESPASYDPFYRLTGYVYNTVIDPVIDDRILPGSINASFVPVIPAPGSVMSDTPIPSPTKSTVLGGVIMTTPHQGGTDFPGFFAADTRGVFVGTLPG